jgi:hypothetical protein
MALMHSENKRLSLVCGIDGCSYYYNTVETFRKHIRSAHTRHWDNESNQLVAMASDTAANCLPDNIADPTSHSTDSSDDIQQRWITILNEFAKHVAMMKLKITECYKLSKLVSYSILQDVQTMFDVYQKNLVDILTCRLHYLGIVVAEDTVLSEILSCDSLFQIIQNKFSTEHLFMKYLSDNMKLVSPVATSVNSSVPQPSVNMETEQTEKCDEAETVSDLGHDVLQFHYVPILDTIKNYLEQPDVWASCQQPQVNSPVLNSFTDGSIWTGCECMHHSDFIRIHLYSDEVEICNPIGSRKTVHKLSTFYFLIGNIETKHWSKLSNIHLALLCKFKNVKTIGYKNLLEPLLNDIKTLETEGIAVELDGVSKRLFGTIVTVSGDNLTSHALGGFQSCFTSGRVCRYCMATKLSLTDTYSEAGCTLRTPEGHMYHVEVCIFTVSL